MLSREAFRCFFVERIEGKVQQSVVEQSLDRLPQGEVTIRVAYSSLNYKDALAASGHPGVVRNFPHIPGIDAAGEVIASSDSRFSPGDQVIATSYEIGAERWGGWSQVLRVPGDWVLPLPPNFSCFDAMALGTAGLTAALSMAAIQEHGILPERGELVVTGATGGVGSLAVMLASKLGYSVVASTGKADQTWRLRQWGAARVIAREELLVPAEKPLLAATYAAAIDTVGGLTLSTLLRQTNHYGCVTACGLVGGAELPVTVHPFILRGITLAGISTAWTPLPRRQEMWNRLAGAWRLALPPDMVETVTLDKLFDCVTRILAGKIAGRVVVDLTNS